MLRSISRAILGIAVLAGASEALAAGPSFAVVDIQKAMEATDHWKKAVEGLQKTRTQKQAELEQKQAQLRAKKEQLDAQKAVSDPAAIANQERDLLADAQALTESFMRSQQELTAKEKKVADQMIGRIEVIVRDLAAEGSYDFVFETGTPEAPNVLYSRPALDITANVITQYNKRFKDKPLTN